jgi:chorismate mutase
MVLRGIRGATTVDFDQPDRIIAGTRELLETILHFNPDLRTEDIASVIFTTTTDLVSVYPALAARQMGWNLVPMMCAQEMPVPGSLRLCIRVLIHWNTETEQKKIRHIYLHNAASLRPDLS